MNKLKTTLLRTHISKHAEERRSQQFAKRLSAAQQTPMLDEARIHKEPPPRVELDELSDRERPAYQSWWKDLDPFNIGRLDDAAVLKFLTGFGLAEHKLEQILALFKDCMDGIDELQFYAILRLVAHAQNGRSVSREMVYLGAPVPHSQTNAIDALIKPTIATSAPTSLTSQQMTMDTRASDPCGVLGFDAWQKQQQQHQEPQQQPQPRPSWTGASQNSQPRPTSWYFGQTQFQGGSVIPSAPSLSPIASLSQIQSIDSNQAAITTTNAHFLFDGRQEHINNNAFPQTSDALKRSSGFGTEYPTMNMDNNNRLSWAQQPQSLSSTTADAFAKSEQKTTYGHSRSRSVPYAVPSDTPTDQTGGFMFDTVGATTTKQQQSFHRSSPLPSRVSMDAESFQRLSSAIDTGQSLLLTKKFVPPKAPNNPFESAVEDSPRTETVSVNMSHHRSPFADESDNASLEASAPPWPGINDRPNKDNIYPPPVPPQSTKPSYLKYARNWFDQQSMMLRRTQSYGISHKANKPHPADPFNNPLPADITPTKDTKLFGSPAAADPSVRLFRHRSDGSSLPSRR